MGVKMSRDEVIEMYEVLLEYYQDMLSEAQAQNFRLIEEIKVLRRQEAENGFQA